MKIKSTPILCDDGIIRYHNYADDIFLGLEVIGKEKVPDWKIKNHKEGKVFFDSDLYGPFYPTCL